MIDTWQPIKEFPQDGTRCLVCTNNGNLTIASWGKVSHVPIYGIIDESYADPNDLDVLEGAYKFMTLDAVKWELSGLKTYLKEKTMNNILKETELFQLTRDNRNHKIAKAIIINNLLLAKTDDKLVGYARKLHNKYKNVLKLKPFDYYLELEDDTIINRIGN